MQSHLKKKSQFLTGFSVGGRICRCTFSRHLSDGTHSIFQAFFSFPSILVQTRTEEGVQCLLSVRPSPGTGRGSGARDGRVRLTLFLFCKHGTPPFNRKSRLALIVLE